VALAMVAEVEEAARNGGLGPAAHLGLVAVAGELERT